MKLRLRSARREHRRQMIATEFQQSEAQPLDGEAAPAPMELTERERELLSLMAEGLSNRGLGRRLCLSERTVEAHVRSIFRKLDLCRTPDRNRRVLAVRRYLRS